MQYIFAKKIKKNDIIFDKIRICEKKSEKTPKIYVFWWNSSQKFTFPFVKNSFAKSDNEKMNKDNELASFINKYTDKVQSINTRIKEENRTAFRAASGENL